MIFERGRELIRSLFHFPHILCNIWCCLPPVLCDAVDNGGTNDDAIGALSHFSGMGGRGDAEADGAGNLRIGLAHQLHHLGDVSGDLAAHSGDTKG